MYPKARAPNVRRVPLTSLGSGIKITPPPYKVKPRPGMRHWAAKLTDDQVREIRLSSLPQKTLAKQFGANQSQISRIRNRQAWCSVADTGDVETCSIWEPTHWRPIEKGSPASGGTVDGA